MHDLLAISKTDEYKDPLKDAMKLLALNISSVCRKIEVEKKIENKTSFLYQ